MTASGIFHAVFLTVQTEIQSPAIASMASLLLGSQSVDLEIHVLLVYIFQADST
jgi:hypothetical protein